MSFGKYCQFDFLADASIKNKDCFLKALLTNYLVFDTARRLKIWFQQGSVGSNATFGTTNSPSRFSIKGLLGFFTPTMKIISRGEITTLIITHTFLNLISSTIFIF
jgi:hypothetical protein